MIKGVNKRIVEVRCMENSNFEKAIFFVNEKNNTLDEKKLLKTAQKYASEFFDKENYTKSGINILKIYKIICVLGAAIACLYICMQHM